MIFDELDAYARVGQPGEELSSEKAEVVQIFKGRAQQIDDHRGTKPAHERDSNTTGKRFVNFGCILEMRVLGLRGLFEGRGRLPNGENKAVCVQELETLPLIIDGRDGRREVEQVPPSLGGMEEQPPPPSYMGASITWAIWSSEGVSLQR
jgi:hypothetical protein